MSSLILWFIAILGIIFLLRWIVKRYANFTERPVQTRRTVQTTDRRIYTIDCTNRNTCTTITRQNVCYDDTYCNQLPPPDYSENYHINLSGNIEKEIVIKSKNELPSYEEVIKQIRETQENNNNNSNNNMNRVDGSLQLEDNNTRTSRSATIT